MNYLRRKFPWLYLQNFNIMAPLFLIHMTFGVILLVGGLFITIFVAMLPANVSGIESITQSIILIMDYVPGIPFELSALADAAGLTIAGLALWFVGLDLLLLGLGLWARSKIAKWIALIFFLTAAFFDFTQFLQFGILGSPVSVLGLTFNGVIFYLLTKL